MVYLIAVIPALLLVLLLFTFTAGSIRAQYDKEAVQLFDLSRELLLMKLKKIEEVSGNIFRSAKYIYLQSGLSETSFDYDAAQLSDELKTLSNLNNDIMMTAVYLENYGRFINNYGSVDARTHLNATFYGEIGDIGEVFDNCVQISDNMYISQITPVQIKNRRHETILLIVNDRSNPYSQRLVMFFLKPGYFLGELPSKWESVSFSLETDGFTLMLKPDDETDIFVSGDYTAKLAGYDLELNMQLLPSFTPNIRRNLSLFASIFASTLFIAALLMAVFSIRDFQYANRIINSVTQIIPADKIPAYNIYSGGFIKESGEIISGIILSAQERYDRRNADIFRSLCAGLAMDQIKYAHISDICPEETLTAFIGAIQLCIACVHITDKSVNNLPAAKSDELMQVFLGNISRLDCSIQVIPCDEAHITLMFYTRIPVEYKSFRDAIHNYLGFCIGQAGSNFRAAAGLSEVAGGWDMLHAAYSEGAQALYYASRAPGDAVLCHKDIVDRDGISFYYPLTSQMELAIGLAFCDVDRYQLVASRLIAANCVNSALSAQAAEALFEILKSDVAAFFGRTPNSGLLPPGVINITSLFDAGLCLLNETNINNTVLGYIRRFDDPRADEADPETGRGAGSRKKIKKLFMERTGFALEQYEKYKSMDHAASLILSGLALNEVHKACGYQNQNVFIRVFKTVYGMPPQKYRRLMMNGRKFMNLEEIT